MEKTIILKISGMHCVSCAMNIDGELEDLGVKDVSTSYAKGETRVTFDEANISPQSLIEAVEKLGYKAQITTS